MTLKSTEELCVMPMKNNANIEDEMTCHEEFYEFSLEHSKI